jgi:hypothetical protein
VSPLRPAALALALLLAACGGDGPAAPAPLPDHDAAAIWAATQARGGARVTQVIELSLPFDVTARATARGDVDLAAGRSRVRVEYDEYGAEAGIGPHDEVVAGPVTYVAKPGSGRWYRFRDDVGGARPLLVLSAVRDVPGLSRLGEDVVRGVRTVRYMGDPEGPIERLEIWVGADGVVLRAQAMFQDDRVKHTVEVEEWGPRTVEVPATSKAVSKDAAYDAIAP